MGSGIRIASAAALAAIVLGTATAAAAPVSQGHVQLVSVGHGQVQGDNDSQAAALSRDGRFVAFASLADNLVPGDTNGAFDVFVRDRDERTTERVSVGPLGEQGDNNSGIGTIFDGPAISAAGRFVAFTSSASNLAPLGVDTNGVEDVFVRDRLRGTTDLISVRNNGKAAGGTEPSISADGRFVSFTSFSDRLTPGDDNFAGDIFVRDRLHHTTRRVSVASDGTQANNGSFASAISADGRIVAFDSFASNLIPGDTNDSVDVFVHDRKTDTTEGISTRTTCDPTIGDVCGNSLLGSLSPNGRFVAFSSPQQHLVAGDDDFFEDAFLVDRSRGTIQLVSQSSQAVKGDNDSTAPLVTGDGHVVVFSSKAGNLVKGDGNGQQDVFRRNLQTGVTERLAADRKDSVPGFPVLADAITADGSQVALETRAKLTAEHATDIFTMDVYLLRLTG